MKPQRLTHLVLVCPWFVSIPALAQNTLRVPTEIAYVSNPALTPVSGGSATLLRIDPQYTLRREDAGTVTEFGFGALIERSSNTSRSANRELPRASVLWQNTSALSVIELRASLEEASTRETEFSDFGRVTLDSTSRTGLLSSRWTREITPESNIELDASHRQVRYDTPLLVGYRETQGNAIYAYQPDENVRYSLGVRAGHLDLDGARRSASLAAVRVGYQRELTENLTLLATVGAARVNLPRRETHALGGVRATYEGERLGYTVAWTHDVSASSALGGYERATAFEAALTYPLTANTTLSLGAGKIRSLETGGDAGTTAFARSRTELSRFWAWTMALESRRATPSGRPSARSNAAVVGLIYENPDF